MKLLQRIIVTVICTLVLCDVFCVSANADSLSANIGYTKTPHLPFSGFNVSPIRYAGIQEAATSLGARSGLAWQGRNIDLALGGNAQFLDQVFDFNQLLLEHNVLPPVLSEDDDSLNLSDNNTLRIASTTYRILNSARFVTAPPNWRDYLWMHFKRPKVTDRSLLPQSQAETMIWNHFFRNGWRVGIEQANEIFTANLNQLKRDMLGMILYRKLLALHMVSPPFVAKAQLGITGDATQLRINDRVLRITAQSQLQPNPKGWTPVLTK